MPNCLTATMAATGPRAINCGRLAPSSPVPIALGSSVEIFALPSIVMGTPVAMSTMATTKQIGTNQYTMPRHMSRKKLPMSLSPRRPRTTARSAARPITGDRICFQHTKKSWLPYDR